MCNNWGSYPLKKQLLIFFGTLTSFALICIGVTNIAYVGIVGNNAQTDLRDGFLAMAETDMKDIITNGANLFDRKLSQLTNNFPNVMAFSAEDSFRADNPFGDIRSHYNWPGDLENSHYSKRYFANVTYDHSAINVFNKTIFDLPNLPSSVKDVIGRTASMDYLYIPTFRSNGDFLQGYMDARSGFQRSYPGIVNESTLSRYIMYNPNGDYWFETVMSDTDSVTYTSPYYDPVANELMITIGRVVHNPINGQIIGAFGSDLVLKTIQNDVKQLNYLGHSRTIMFEKSTGYIIADSKNEINKLTTYTDVINPKISENLWNKVSTENGKLIIDSNYYFLSVLLSIIDQSYVLGTFSDIMSLIGKIIASVIAIVAGVFVAEFLITLPLSILLTKKIVEPLAQLAKLSAHMANNLGKSSLVSGSIRRIEMKPTGIYEVDQAMQQFGRAMDALGRPHTTDTQTTNPYYGQNPWNIAPLPANVLPPMPTRALAVAVPVPLHDDNAMGTGLHGTVPLPSAPLPTNMDYYRGNVLR
jgi:hypothetical protein